MNTTLRQPVVRPASYFSPDRWTEAASAIIMVGYFPARPLIRKQIQVSHFTTAARTNQRSVPLVAILYDNIEHIFSQVVRQFLDERKYDPLT